MYRPNTKARTDAWTPQDLEITGYHQLMNRPVTAEDARLSFARMKEMIRGG